MSEIFNVSTNPHVRSKDTTQTIMRDVLIALAPASIFGIYNFGVQALIRIIVGIAVCMASEAVYEYFMHKKITVMDLSAAVTGLLIALNIPSTLNIGFEIVGCVFAIIIVKQLFGGIGQNFMNPALAARCFLLIAYTGPMTNFVCDAYSGATPLAILKPGSEVVGQTAPTLLTMFIGKTSGVIGETSVICLLIGAIYLVVRKIISLRIPLSYIGTFAVLIFLFAPGHQFDAMYMLQEICGGGLILGAFFMATDYVTSPITPAGKVVFGVILGILTFCFRIYGGSAEGVSYAIIFSNLLVPLIERWTQPKSFGEGAELAAQGDTAGTKSKMDTKSIVIATIAIMIITVIAGFALAYVYKITKDPIAVTEQKAKEEAYKAVFDDADSFDSYADFDADAAAKILSDAGYNADIDEIVEAKGSDGSALGYVVTVTSHEAYSGDLQLAMGVRADGTTNGISFLSLSETAGLGMEADTDSFKSQFAGKKVDKFQYTKSGATVDEEIDALSGATITTNAVTNAVNAGLEYVKSINGGAADSSAASNGGDK